MKPRKIIAILAVTTSLVAPGIALALPVTFSTKMNNYGGDGAYLAYYVTDSSGAYVGSLWMAGSKAKYYKSLTDWYRATGGDLSEVDGITGASVGAGKSLDIRFDLPDSVFESGYVLHIDASVEHMRDSPSEIIVPLSKDAAGQPVQGRGYIAEFEYDF